MTPQTVSLDENCKHLLVYASAIDNTAYCPHCGETIVYEESKKVI